MIVGRTKEMQRLENIYTSKDAETDKPFLLQKSYVETLKAKIETFRKITKKTKQLFLALISANGLKKMLIHPK